MVTGSPCCLLFCKEFTRNVIEPLKVELVIIRKQVLDTRAQASKAQDAFAENFENYMDGKISKEQFSENAIPIKENMKRLEVEEREQREVMDAMDAKMDSIAAMKQLLRDFLKTKDLSKEVVEALLKRIVVGVEHAFTVEYKFDFGE